MHADGNDYGNPGDFDFYVLEELWPAQSCWGLNTPLCQNPTSYMRVNTTLHGLWPQYAKARDGHQWPQCCQLSNWFANASTVHPFIDSMRLNWPDRDTKAPDSYTWSDFWAHESDKHLSCTGLNETEAFELALNVHLLKPTPAWFGEHAGELVPLQKLYAAFSAPLCLSENGCILSIDCVNGSYFNSVVTCWQKDDLEPMICPPTVTIPRSCPSIVQMSAFS